jgi:hypothetical protein
VCEYLNLQAVRCGSEGERKLPHCMPSLTGVEEYCQYRTQKYNIIRFCKQDMCVHLTFTKNIPKKEENK